MKKMFEMPEVAFERFSVEDVITTSTTDTGEGGTTIVNPFGPNATAITPND